MQFPYQQDKDMFTQSSTNVNSSNNQQNTANSTSSTYKQSSNTLFNRSPNVSSSFLPFAPLTSSQDYLLNSPTINSLSLPKSPLSHSPSLSNRIGSSPLGINTLNSTSSNTETVKERYLGSIKMEVEQLIEMDIGPTNTLDVHITDTDKLAVMINNDILAYIPDKTSQWLSTLLKMEKIRLQARGSSTEGDNTSLYLFIQVFIIIPNFKKNMDNSEKLAWVFLSEAIGRRKPASSSVSAPILPLSTSTIRNSPVDNILFTANDTVPRASTEGSLGSRLIKRSTINNLVQPPLKYSKHNLNDSIGEQSSLEGNLSSTGDYMAKQLFDNLNKNIGKEIEPSKSLCCSLRPYQKQALCWLVERENCGKKQHNNIQDISQIKENEGNILPPGWKELETEQGTKYYYNQLTKTTHWEFPLNDMTHKKSKNSIRGGILADEMGMGKTIEILSLILTNTPHLLTRIQNYNFDGKPNQDYSNPNSKIPLNETHSTLIVCPLSVLTQWTQEMQNHSVPNFLSIYVYHGANRNKDPKFLHNHDIVITTYATLATELPSEKKSSKTNHESKKNVKKEKGALLQVNWLRVVLDEAHTIKDRTTRTAKSAFELKSERKWCVTGTPIQNKLDDLFSLLHFLQVEPFCDYNWWNQVIMKPIRSRDDKGFARLQTILQSILLRRTKTQRINNVPIVSLPPRIMKVTKIPFMKEEEDFYKALWDNAKTKFNKYVEIGTVLRNYAHILELLLRLRQACDHPNLVVSSRSKNAKNVNKLLEKYLKESHTIDSSSENFTNIFNRCNINDIECLICLEMIDTPVITPCGHLFCKECIEREFTNLNTKNTKCPCCSYSVTKKQLIPIPVSPITNQEQNLSSITTSSSSSIINEKEQNWNTSSKIEALLQELISIWEKDPSTKSIVFSQWTSMLDLVELPLQKMGIKFVRLDGSMSQSNRQVSVDSFNSNPEVKVFLISMKAGGLGLNLVSASCVFLLDPWWNPATEQQAIDRVHRLGQTKPVFVTRFIIRGTIEERILELQDKKRRLVQGALGRHAKELRKIRLDELRLLFRD